MEKTISHRSLYINLYPQLQKQSFIWKLKCLNIGFRIFISLLLKTVASFYKNFVFFPLLLLQRDLLSTFFTGNRPKLDFWWSLIPFPHPLTGACLRRDYNSKLFNSNRENLEIHVLFPKNKSPSPSDPAAVKFPGDGKNQIYGFKTMQVLGFLVLFWAAFVTTDMKSWIQECWASTGLSPH